MKLLHKLGIVALVLSLGLILVGCGKEEAKEKNIEGSLTDIMTKVYEQLPEDKRPMGLTNMEVNAENIEGFLGTSDIEYDEALASESMVGSIAHSVVLVRVAKGADVEATKKAIKDNVNPRKWICVGVEDEKNVIVDNRGDLIVLIMENTHAQTIHENFKNLK